MALTRLQIITEGLTQAGRTDLTSNGRLWLNLFLEDQYMNQDWKWLLKSADDLSCTNGVAFPSDYRSGFNATLGDTRTPIKLVEGDEFDLHNQVSAVDGTPTIVYADHVENKFYFYPAPASGLTWNLKYYYLPTLPTHATSAGDGDTPVWGLPDSVLVQAIFVKALQYNDDARADAEEQKLVGQIAQAKMNNHDQRMGSHKFKMGKSFRKRF
jgi:hypothetical protein